MSTVSDPKENQLHVCIRARGIVGYGATPQQAEAMADAIEAAQGIVSEPGQIVIAPKYRYNISRARYEIVERQSLEQGVDHG